MRRVVLALFTLFALTFGMTTSASATNHNCGDYVSQAAAQSVYNADTSDPKGLDGPPGPTSAGEPGVACEDYDYANNPGTNPGLLGGGGNTDTDGDTSTGGGSGTTGNTATTVPAVGSGTGLYTSHNNIMLVTAFGSVAAVLGLAALRLRQQS